MRKLALLLAAPAALLGVTSCTVPMASTPVAAAQSVAWNAFMNNYIEQSFRANPNFAVSQGRHEYDGQVIDLSPGAIASEVSRLRSAIVAAQSFPAAGLTANERFERDYLLANARGSLFWISPEGADKFHRNPAAYLDAMDPSVYVTVPYAAPEVRLRAYTKFLNEVPRVAAQMRPNLRTPLPISFVDYGKNAFGGFADYFPGDGLAAWKGVGTAAEQAALLAATARATAAMKTTAAWVEGQRKSAGTNFGLGRAKFQQMLWDTEMVSTPLDQLEAMGRADMASNQALLRQACARYAPGATVPACMDKMNADKPEGGAVAGARAQLAGLKQFIIDHDLVTIPGTEEAKVEEAPPYNRQNFAYINIPGLYEHGLASTYYIAPPDPSWSQKVRDEFVPGKAVLLATSVHEVWPGHFLNFLHSNRSPFLFGRIFVGYAYAEGWAHYTEEMMRVAGVGGGTDEVMIGQLSDALLRNCRFLSAIGMHSGTMTQAQSLRLFREQCFQDEGTARQQAARGTYDPAYLNYTMGKLMIRRLRDDWTATRGGRAGWKAFHDQFLSYGGPPIPLVRQQMMGGAAQAVF
ncbi:MAG: DUF885 domain-containing protein [Sphingomicrobium sp.]